MHFKKNQSIKFRVILICEGGSLDFPHKMVLTPLHAAFCPPRGSPSSAAGSSLAIHLCAVAELKISLLDLEKADHENTSRKGLAAVRADFKSSDEKVHLAGGRLQSGASDP